MMRTKRVVSEGQQNHRGRTASAKNRKPLKNYVLHVSEFHAAVILVVKLTRRGGGPASPLPAFPVVSGAR